MPACEGLHIVEKATTRRMRELGIFQPQPSARNFEIYEFTKTKACTGPSSLVVEALGPIGGPKTLSKFAQNTMGYNHIMKNAPTH